MAVDDITSIHHIGLIVRDMDAALDAFRRFGFQIGAPAYPALPPSPGEEPEPVGAGNTHADFPRGFIELLALAPQQSDRLPEVARLIPLQVPDEHLAATRAVIGQTVANLEARLAIAEGAHILVFACDDAETTAARLEANGVGSSGARTAQRPVATAEGTKLGTIKFLEINDDDPGSPPGMVPEGRVGVAEDVPAELLDAQTGLDHPNGAVRLAECVICVDEDQLTATTSRYERYLGRAAAFDGPSAVFDLGSSRLALTTAAALEARLPGEKPYVTPSLSAYTIEVTDLTAAEGHLRSQGVPVRRTADGRPFVPAEAALGAALVFEQAATD
ncbi:VOC family protein [Glycomyces sp. TRM65418]|uniref:VOC family protein n=1 Tax=Glycomyces sp. TRM65418 TaxID=2867006 RepID=UPI001CE6E19F|nr:VOC family protein [Glycomyces sp. TRM65418]MCC3765065.1 VOC family protein [Glycomyces sp. TRM65418]QZD54694.1 VOC family protein [Glycomyces sp. TRM65418]